MAAKKLTPEQKERKRQTDKLYCAKNSATRSARARAWVEANPERAKANRARYLAANPEGDKATRRSNFLAWQKAHPEETRARRRKWINSHPENNRLNSRNRRAREAGALGRHTASDIARLFELQGAKCAACKSSVSKSGKGQYHVDHVMPLRRGGSNGPENLQLLCATCNVRKKDKHPDDWAKANGLLFI